MGGHVKQVLLYDQAMLDLKYPIRSLIQQTTNISRMSRSYKNIYLQVDGSSLIGLTCTPANFQELKVQHRFYQQSCGLVQVLFHCAKNKERTRVKNFSFYNFDQSSHLTFHSSAQHSIPTEIIGA